MLAIIAKYEFKICHRTRPHCLEMYWNIHGQDDTSGICVSSPAGGTGEYMELWSTWGSITGAHGGADEVTARSSQLVTLGDGLLGGSFYYPYQVFEVSYSKNR